MLSCNDCLEGKKEDYQNCSLLYCVPLVPTHPGKSWNVKKGIFQAWKVTENDCDHGKSWKSHGIPTAGREIF